MGARTRRIDIANEQAASIRRRIGADVRVTRLGEGLSIDRASGAAGLSPSTFGRIERGVLETATIEQLCRACAAVGLRFRGAAYPAAAGVREAGHAHVLE